MTTILSILKASVGMLIILLLCLLSRRIRVRKNNRAKYFPIPILTLIYTVTGMILIGKVLDFIDWIIDLLTEHFAFFEKVTDFFGLASFKIILANIVLVVGYLIVKIILMPILCKIWKSCKKLLEMTSGHFYVHDEDIDHWVLKKKFYEPRKIFKGLYIAALVVSSLIFILARLFPKFEAFRAVFYPCVGILILGEVYTYLDGMTKKEFAEDILGEDEDSFKVANYGMLRKLLRDLFPDKILYDNTLGRYDGISESYDTLEELYRSEDDTERIVGSYFSELKKDGTDIDENYVKSCLNLMNSKSTLFYNPFYKDLTEYIMLPLFNSLVNYRNCLVVTGRDSEAESVKEWIAEGLENFTGTDSLWKVEILNNEFTETNVGIIKSSDIHNLDLHKENAEFLKKVGFIILIEPSRMLSSGQIGLNILVNRCENPDSEIIFCGCDRNCDGLVDALSHVLKTSITEVTATAGSAANSSHMYWNADGKYMHHRILPNISRYLGVGTEISSVALKHQIPFTKWIGSEKFPVVDMRWIAGQYYKQICDYADMPESQDALNRSFCVDSDLWNGEQTENSFIIVEDEFQNLFEMTRVFASRAKNQGFINVISENYLLRDYMVDNVDVLTADPKAIPTIVPDYARTERNTVLKLIMMMMSDSVSEERIRKELTISGIALGDTYETLKKLIVKHCGVNDGSLSVRFVEEIDNNLFTTNTVKYFEISEQNEIYDHSRILKNAYFIAEDELGEKNYIGARLYGHVFQSYLPGQFITLDGKYYEVQTITPENGVVLRRAADHINGRHYYRQIKSIDISCWNDDSEMGRQKTISDIEVAHGFADIIVSTNGYIDMSRYGDFKRGKEVRINGIPDRKYKNKGVLRIKLPGSSPKVRCTVCLLLNEIFRTAYPNSYQYIYAVTESFAGISENLKYTIPSFSVEGKTSENEYIYIVEDSEIDLGLTVSTERNLKRYFEIIYEVLEWHKEKAAETDDAEEESASSGGAEIADAPLEFAPPKKKRGIFGRIKDFFSRHFGKKKKKKKEADSEEEITPGEPEYVPSENDTIPEESPEVDAVSPAVEEITEEKPEEADENGEVESEEDSEDSNEPILHSKSYPTMFRDIDDIPEEYVDDVDVGGDDEELADPESVYSENRYMNHCFLKFGFDEIDDVIDVDGVLEYLTKYGYDVNPLGQARKGEDTEDELEKIYDPQKFGVHLCDFCGKELVGGEYEVLKDGRERCNRCSRTAVRKADDFKELYKSVIRNMEVFYGIKINTAIKVRTTDAKKIARHVGEKFEPTPGFDGRTLGFAKKDKTGYSIYIENGSPKLAATATIAHELTHIWQYLNWKDSAISKRYGKRNKLEVYEGMAKWAEIQYLMLLNETSYAKRQEIMTRMRDDVYGHGFIKYAAKYPLSEATSLKRTPFGENPPL